MTTLTLIALAGLLGPLLAMSRRIAVPVVVGEIIGGVLIGPAGLGKVALGDPLVDTLHAAGFALLMFTIGMHLPLRDPRLRTEAKKGLLATLVVYSAGAIIGVAIANITGVGHPVAMMLLLANSSAALAVPILRNGSESESQETATLIVWIMLADIAAIVLIPLTGASTSVWQVLLGSIAVTAAAWLAFLALDRAGRTEWWKRMRELSHAQGWGWTLRVALVFLFALTLLAERLGTSALVAGFSCGVAVSALGVSDRLLREVVGLAEVFFIPAFFVILGTSLDPVSLSDPRLIGFGALLVAGSVAVHQMGSWAARLGLRRGLVASAQMGVPAAIVTVGTAEGWLSGGEASAVVAASAVSIFVCAVGSALLGHPFRVRIRGSWRAFDPEGVIDTDGGTATA